MPESSRSRDISAGASLTVYNLLLPAGLLLALPGFALKMLRRGGYGAGFAQRFGNYSDAFAVSALDRSERPIWVHAVSVGEVLIARKLIAELLRQSPATPIVLSTTTSTGHRVAREHLSDTARVIYNPIDLRWIVTRAMDRIRPRALVLVEAEVWPNLVAEAVDRRIPVLLVNARLSPRSEQRYLHFRKWVAPVFRMLSHVCVQEPEDIARWTGLGLAPEHITHTGSIKFDQGHAATAAAAALDPHRDAMVHSFRSILRRLWGDALPKTVLLASSHNGEEAAVGRAILTLRQKFPELKFLVAPRHFERADAVERDLQSLGLVTCRRSSLSDSAALAEAEGSRSDTLIIDSTGELSAWQVLPDIVVIGKSFLSTGGQNPVEAIAAGTPVIAGPHMENFAALVAVLLKRKGIVQVDGIEQLVPAMTELLLNPSAAATRIDNARRALDDHTGATRRTVACLRAQLEIDSNR